MSERGRHSVSGVWLVRWRVIDDALSLVAFEQHLVERAELASPSPTVPWIPDVTDELFGPSPSDPAGAQLGRAQLSLQDLRDVLDVDIGVGLLGHHGVAIADVSGDGLDDVFVLQPGGVPNQLWIRSPNGRALDLASSAGLDHLDVTRSALLLDLDGDGDRDAVLGLGDGVQFMVQTRDGFIEGPFVERANVSTLAAADVDSDGRIDIYACAYVDPYRGGAGVPIPYHDAENGESNLLLVNHSDEFDALRFTDETEARGLHVAARRFSLSATFDDIDDDGDPDLYVANDFGRNALYINDGEGRFEERARAYGVEDIGAGMGAVLDDVDGDGIVDLYVSNMESSAGRRVTGRAGFRRDVPEDVRAVLRRHAKGSTFFRGASAGGFIEAAGVASQARWAWGGTTTDLDGDGLFDLLVPNGFVSARRDGAPDL